MVECASGGGKIAPGELNGPLFTVQVGAISSADIVQWLPTELTVGFLSISPFTVLCHSKDKD